MKKVFLFAIAALMVSSVAFAEGNDKGKRKKAKKSCCSAKKSCHKMK
jgi:hypothetical protein